MKVSSLRLSWMWRAESRASWTATLISLHIYRRDDLSSSIASTSQSVASRAAWDWTWFARTKCILHWFAQLRKEWMGWNEHCSLGVHAIIEYEESGAKKLTKKKALLCQSIKFAKLLVLSRNSISWGFVLCICSLIESEEQNVLKQKVLCSVHGFTSLRRKHCHAAIGHVGLWVPTNLSWDLLVTIFVRDDSSRQKKNLTRERGAVIHVWGGEDAAVRKVITATRRRVSGWSCASVWIWAGAKDCRLKLESCSCGSMFSPVWSVGSCFRWQMPVWIPFYLLQQSVSVWFLKHPQ